MIKGGYLLSAGSEGEIHTLWNVQELRTKMVTSSFAVRPRRSPCSPSKRPTGYLGLNSRLAQGIVCICSPTQNDCPPSREEALANENSVSVDGKDEL